MLIHYIHKGSFESHPSIIYCEGGVSVFPRGRVQVISKILRRIFIKALTTHRHFDNYSSQNFADDLHAASWENIDTSLTVKKFIA